MRHWEYSDRHLWLVRQPWWLGALDLLAVVLDRPWLDKIRLPQSSPYATLGDWVFEHLVATLIEYVEQHPKRELYRVPVEPKVLEELFRDADPFYFEALQAIREKGLR